MIVAIVVAVVCAVSAGRLPMLHAVELRLLDWRLRAPHPSPCTDDILIVGIESATFEKLRTWGPAALDRAEYAPVIRNLSKHGAKLIALDVYFGDADTSPEADQALAEAIGQAGNVILVADAEPQLTPDGSETVEFTPPTQQITTAARAIASPLLSRPQHVVREVQPRQRGSEGTSYPALSFEVFIRVRTPGTEVTAPVMINWAGKAGTVQRVRFEDVYDDKVDPSRIAGRVAFIGITDEQKDLFATPVGPMSGIEIHAQAAATMLAGSYIAQAGHSTSLVAAIMLCVLLAVFAVGRRAWPVLLGAGVLLALWVAGGYTLFRARALDIPMTGTAVSLIACGVLLSVLQSERVVGALSKLWPSWVSIEGEEIEATVLVCDLAGYTAKSEAAAPGEMMRLVREFFAIVDEVMEPFAGVLARRPGDAAIVFFRPEEGREHHARRAVAAALALCERLPQAWQESNLGFGITLTTGTVSLGFVGTTPPEPQILGDPVNVAFRLQSESRRLGEPIITDWPTATADPQTSKVMRPLGEVQVEGRRAPVQIFAPLADVAARRP